MRSLRCSANPIIGLDPALSVTDVSGVECHPCSQGHRLIHHSDRGCQYASRYYRQSLANSGITASMSRKGNCYDNAAMESFWATLKTEGFNEKELKTRRETELMVFDYVEAFYNPRRLHTGIGGMSPMEFEMKQQQQRQNQEQQKQKHQSQNQRQQQQQQQQHTPLN